MTTRRLRSPFVLLFLSLLLAAPASAAEPTADEIIKRSSENRTVSNSIQKMTLEIYDKSGNSRIRKITSRTRKGPQDATWSYVYFDEPEDVAGVQFLSVENPTGEDDQWMFMPAIGTANRIAGSSRKGSFMGTDFSYEDMSLGQADDGDHTMRAKTSITVAGETFEVHVVETVPKAETKSAYTKVVTYVDVVEFMPRQVDLFDKKGEQIKRMSFSSVEKSGEVLVPKLITMENLKRGTKTNLKVDEYEVNVDASKLPDEMFTKEYIEGEG
ncbi:MAG: outer membrane lipoprotein-sorting protein [Deltaproteobacteria bacterium]|nr:outer membrane lipoprotein-sorting protein [Deltaproteobacteria bacterium]